MKPILAAADADVAGGHVGVGPMCRQSSVMKLWQKRMTSLSLLPFGSKSEPPLPPPIGSVVSAVLEDLLEGEELQDAEVDARVEAQAALVRADRAVHLDAEAAVDLDVALVVDPRHAEHHHALGLDDALEDLALAQSGALVEHRRQRGQDSSTAWWNSGSPGFLALVSLTTEAT
jgi:hypothetical protein